MIEQKLYVGEPVGGACCEKPHKFNIPYVDLPKGKKPNPKPCMQQERLSQNLLEIVQAIWKVDNEEPLCYMGCKS